MPTENSSSKPSPKLEKPLRADAEKRTTKLGRGLAEGLRQAAAHFRGDITLRSYEHRIPGPVDVRAIRHKLGLSQSEFAARYALNPRTVQEWEQGRSEPDLAARAYLTVIDRDPQAVDAALGNGL